MLPLLLLGLIELTTASWPYYPGPSGPQSPFPFSIPWEAQQELNNIQNNPNLTRQQYENRMNQWAKKFGLKDKFDAYKKNINDQRIKAQQKLDAALKALPNYYRQLRNIENDNTLTRPQADQKRRELLNTLTYRLTLE
ncbi:hypothetical protein ANCCAN_17955 [Ancylostoma caninum]|uniref:SXP/RAL-2 family protein Ani s 5-like cation-binding domain-containing protein n=1 Tax=Ancylostoma caninum TaxID=29170 RepID=A0A368FVC5_ANCCA|nr:hypothetical protein ANCCAN_17955 [Ancylostoma caninum]